MKKIADKTWNKLDKILIHYAGILKSFIPVDPNNKNIPDTIDLVEDLRAAVSLQNLPGDDICKWRDLGGGCFVTTCGQKMDICDKMIYCGHCGNKIKVDEN